MTKKIYFFIYFLFASVTPITAEETVTTFTDTVQNHSETLLRASYRYVDFINRIGKGDIFAQTDAAALVIAPECKKIFNAHLFARNREDFIADLLSVYENHGCWKIIPIEVIRAPLDNIVILRLIIEAENLGTNTAIVILRYDVNYLITEINEVFSPVKGSYDFESNK